VFITAGMGQGMVRRLASKNIKGLVTQETDPETAVSLYLQGALQAGESNGQQHHDSDGE
jgi:predicted Fe-Mo cluster-binding NifX family protein